MLHTGPAGADIRLASVSVLAAEAVVETVFGRGCPAVALASEEAAALGPVVHCMERPDQVGLHWHAWVAAERAVVVDRWWVEFGWVKEREHRRAWDRR